MPWRRRARPRGRASEPPDAVRPPITRSTPPPCGEAIPKVNTPWVHCQLMAGFWDFQDSAIPHGGVPPFRQKSTCLAQFILGPCVVHIWSRNAPDFGRNKTCVAFHASEFAVEGSTGSAHYRGTSLTRNRAPLRPYSMTMPRALWWSWGWGGFL